MWAVGGVAPITQGIPDGRGGLLRSGTNAPLYTTTFSARPKAQEDKEKHEDRLAEALELYRVGRVLEFRESLSPTKRPPTNKKHKDIETESRTIWTGTEWTMEKPDHSMLNSKVSPTTSLHTSCSVQETNAPKKCQQLKKSELFHLHLSSKSLH